MKYHELMGMPPDYSSNGLTIDSLIFWMHVLMAVLFVGWGLFFVYTLVRFRAGRNPKADYHGVKSHASSYLEVAVAIVEVVLLVGISIPVWAERANDPEDVAGAMRVRVVAEQFAWNFHYPGPDGVFGPTKLALVRSGINPVGLDKSDPTAADDIVSINQLRLIKDRTVVLEISSKDVIHSLSIPKMRVKQDAIPGMSSMVWFKPVEFVAPIDLKDLVGADQEQKYIEKYKVPPGIQGNIACAQLCGNQHAVMKGFLYVETEEAFKTWALTMNPNARY